MDRIDIAIIGSGPAGLSAAITAKIRNKSIILFGDKDLSMKISKAHTIYNYLGIPKVSGSELGMAFKAHLEDMNIDINEEKVTAIYAMGNFFGIQTSDNMYEASAVILATGVIMAKPYPNEEELLGKGVSYCATCDAPLYRGKTIAIIGESEKEEDEVRFMGEIAAKVYYFPLYETNFVSGKSVEVIKEKPLSILGDEKVSALKTSENEYLVDGIFILRESVSPKQLIFGIQLDGNHVVADRLMNTSIPGCFACGDITGTPYQYIKSAGEGNVAAISAALYIDKKKSEK